MRKKIAVGVVFAAMSSLMVGAPASADHCTDDGSPGNSYFGTDYVQENNGPGGGATIGGTNQGFSSCNPSGRQ